MRKGTKATYICPFYKGDTAILTCRPPLSDRWPSNYKMKLIIFRLVFWRNQFRNNTIRPLIRESRHLLIDSKQKHLEGFGWIIYLKYLLGTCNAKLKKTKVPQTVLIGFTPPPPCGCH